MLNPWENTIGRPYARYLLATAIVCSSFLLRYELVTYLGIELPTFLTFYPAVMSIAILAGFWPGVLATFATVIGTDYLILEPVGSFKIAKLGDLVSLVFFTVMGLLMSWLAEHYRRGQRDVLRYKTEQAAWASNNMLEVAMAGTTDAVFISDITGNFTHFNEGFAHFHKFKSKADCAKTLAAYPDFLEVSSMDGVVLPLDMWAVPRALRGESATNAEYRLRRKNTGEEWIGSYSFNPLKNSEGAIIGAAVVGRDITESKRAEKALLESEKLYHNLFNSMEEGFCIVEVLFNTKGKPEDYRFLVVNEAFEKQTGLHDAVGQRMLELYPRHEQHWFDLYGKVALTGRPAHTSDLKGLNRFFDVRAYRVGEPEQRQVAIVFSDISERKRSSEHIQRLLRVYAVLSDINQTIVREKDSQKMMEAACRIAIDKGKFRMAWIGMVNPETQQLEPIASSGTVDGYLDIVKIDLVSPEYENGPSRQSIFSGQHAVCNDIENDPYFLPWRREALRRGYRSSAGFPLKVDGKVIGVFNFYANELAFFDNDELQLLDEMAMDISFALEVNRHEVARSKSEVELRWRTAFFEAQVDSALDGILVVDNNGVKILQNERMNEIMGIPKEIAENQDDSRQLHFVSTVVKNSEQFVDKVNHLNTHPDEISRDEIELLDGRLLDRYSSPVRDKLGNYYGRIWTFRDITKRRQLEERFRQTQ